MDSNQIDFYSKVEKIDSLIKNKEIKLGVKVLPGLFSKSETLKNYFFIELNDEDWLDPLIEAGLIRIPSESDIEKSKKKANYILWPEHSYLKKITEKKPERILNLILEIWKIDNSIIHNKALDIAEKLPPKYLNQFIDNEVKWIRENEKLNIRQPERYFDLGIKLIQNGFKETALIVVVEILGFRGLKREKYLGVDITPKLDSWYYEKVSKKYIPKVIDHIGENALNRFLDLLEKFIAIKDYGQKPNDGSFFWRPAIEDHKQNEPLSFEDHLIDSIRDSIQNKIKTDKTSLPIIIESLESRGWYIFIRMSLNLLESINEPSDYELFYINDRILNYKYFDSFWCSHEYSSLIQKHFGKLSKNSKDQVINWIKAGPKENRIEDHFEDEEITEEKRKSYSDRWRRDKLSWIVEDLDENWKDIFEKLKEDVGDPGPTFPVYSFGGTGFVKSPLSIEEFKEKSINELVKYLNEFEEPKDTFQEPSKEGLGNTLTAVFAEEPNIYSNDLLQFKNIEPKFLRAIFQGYRDATSNNKDVEWDNLITLIEWVVKKFKGIETNDVDDGVKQNWKWTIDSILNLIREEFKTKENLSFDFKDKIWAVLSDLSEVQYPTPEEEREQLKRNMDASTLSLNTTRGKALHAVFRYIDWYKVKGDVKDFSFKHIPKVKVVLEKHLDIDSEPLLSIRSIYGQWLPFLISVDKKWVIANCGKIFPEERKIIDYFNAAWTSYITYNRPYADVLPVLSNKYKYAIDLSNYGEISNKLGKSPRSSLAQHIMVYYWWDDLNLNSDLFNYFWNKADDTSRTEAISFVGRSLKQSNQDSLSLEIKERLKKLWEYRWDSYKEDPKTYNDEISEFGIWITADVFETEWVLNNFEKINDLKIPLKEEYFIIDFLVDHASEYPEMVLKCSEGFIKNARHVHDVNYWKEKISNIIETVRSSKDRDLEMRIYRFVNYLGSLNYNLLVNFKPLNEELKKNITT